MNFNFDPVAFLREFGLSVAIVVVAGWFVVAAGKAIFPAIGAAIGRWFDAQTKQIEETTTVIRKIPEVIAQTSKETQEAIIAFEKAIGMTETRVRDDLRGTEIRIRDDIRSSSEDLCAEIHNEQQTRIEKGIDRLAKKVSGSKEPDTDPLGPKK